jgi:hypothetical protein
MVTRFLDFFEVRVSKEVDLQVANKVHAMRHSKFLLPEAKN